MDVNEGLSVKVLFQVTKDYSGTARQTDRSSICSTAVASQLLHMSGLHPDLAANLRAYADSVGTPDCQMLNFDCPIQQASGRCEGKQTVFTGPKRRLADKLASAHRQAWDEGKEDVAALLGKALEMEAARRRPSDAD